MSQKWVRAKQWDDRHLPRMFDPARYWIGRFGAARFWGALGAVAVAYALLWVELIGPWAEPAAARAGVWVSAWLVPGVAALYLVWPVKFVLRALSSIPLAVVLLSMVALYGTLASVPIGLVAKVPTVLLYGLTLVLAVALVAAAPTWLVTRAMRGAGAGRGARFVVGFLGFQVLAVATVWLWVRYAWPRLHFDPVEGTGVMLFADFVEKYKSVTLRRLPGFEMSEIEFYGWWPLRVVLLLFVANMVTATVRRIEFSFPYIGVLTVHTGIVTIALGSVYYQRLKVEGDMLLLAGEPDEKGDPAVGPPEGGFYDNTEVVLWVSQGGQRRPEQRLLRGLPRYNDYNLNALGLTGEFEDAARAWDDGRKVSIEPQSLLPRGSVVQPGVDPDVRVRVVGYASYAELVKRTVPAPTPADAGKAQPVRVIELLSGLPEGYTPTPGAARPKPVEPRTVYSEELFPTVPARRVLTIQDSVAIECTRGLSDARWEDLKATLPRGAAYGLIVEIPGQDGGPARREVHAAREGSRIEVGGVGGVAGTGYVLEVTRVSPEPPFPIVTPGYDKAHSSVAVVRVTPPALPDGTKLPVFDRWVYSRFPELSQDLVPGAGENGMPRRRPADPGIKVTFIDASMVQVHFDERVPGAGASPAEAEDPPVRAIVRLPGRDPAEIAAVRTGERVQIDEMAYIGLGPRIANSLDVEFPVPTPEAGRDKQAVGTHAKAAVAVQVTAGEGTGAGWTRTVWVPFSKYVGVDPSVERSVTLPDGRRVGLLFGRRRRTLPEMALKLTSFEMTSYEHSDIPRDYRSDVVVVDWWEGAPREREWHTSLNDPLLVSVPFRKDGRAAGMLNAVGWLLSQVAPDSYKFSQAGWDSEGWARSKEAAQAGRAAKPWARFTILGVGNNPGITIIAAGAVMMSLGIPWAFYVKPMIMKGRKKRLQRELAAKIGEKRGGTGVPPGSGERVEELVGAQAGLRTGGTPVPPEAGSS
jgi:hypothetical protein